MKNRLPKGGRFFFVQRPRLEERSVFGKVVLKID
jgi:hypothetical protein